jgi:hypothetical protein
MYSIIAGGLAFTSIPSSCMVSEALEGSRMSFRIPGRPEAAFRLERAAIVATA